MRDWEDSSIDVDPTYDDLSHRMEHIYKKYNTTVLENKHELEIINKRLSLLESKIFNKKKPLRK